MRENIKNNLHSAKRGTTHSKVRRPNQPQPPNHHLFLLLLALVTFIIVFMSTTIVTQDPIPDVISESNEETTPTEVVDDNNKLMYTTNSVYLREEPKKSSEPIMLLPENDIVKSEKEENDWNYVYVDTVDKGWIKSENLREYDKKAYIDIPLEFQHQDLVKELINTFELDIDEYVIYGLMYTESRFNHSEVSYVGATGIMQVMPGVWDEFYTKFCMEYPEKAKELNVVNDITDKTSNITIGVYCIKYLTDICKVDSTSNNISMILTSYNRGKSGAQDYFTKNGSWVSEYSQSVLRAAEYLRTNHTWNENM